MNDDSRLHPDGQGIGNLVDGVDHFTSAAPSVPVPGIGCTHCDLSEHGIVRVSGPDAKQFLQGQCTVDMDQLSGSTSRLGAFCNPKGRVLCLALFVVDEADYLLRMPQANIDSMLERLGRYVLRARVEMIEENAIRGVGIVTGEPLGEIAVRLPEAPYDALRSDIGWIVRVPGEPPRFEVYGSNEQLAGLRSRLPESVWFDAKRWELLNIRAGVPEIYPTSSELFVPQMLALERLGGVSFTKGCYTGQEIVARTQYLGSLKRRLVRARISQGVCPLPGTTLFALGNSSNREAVGSVVCAAADQRGASELLAVVQNSALDKDPPAIVTEHSQGLENIGPAASEDAGE